MAQAKLKISDEDIAAIGDNEVFLTNHLDKVFADSIHKKCQVYNIEDYYNLEETDVSTTFFMRATFDVQK